MSELDELKRLLFGAEKQALDTIMNRVERRETRAVDVADILPEAIHQSHQRGCDLADSLKAPVTECLREAIREDPQSYGDALYPVMGPAIRKSITQALRTLAQQINEAVEQSLTPKGLKWRFHAWRAGVPFGEFVMQKTLLYRVEQAYLISRDNGLLVSHVHHEEARIKDSDAVSAMFTAIQDFVKESFSPDRTGRLESADMGEFTLWAVHGPHALLVCVIRGVPPRALRGELSAVLERIHFRHGDALKAYAGDTGSLAGVDEELAACLRFEARQRDDRPERKVPLPLLILLTLAGAALVYVSSAQWLLSRKAAELGAALESTPGFYVAGVEPADGRLVVHGLRDPIAPSVAAVAESIGVSAQEVSSAMRPFQSLEPEILTERAARVFGRPDGVVFSMHDSTLVVAGPAPVEWQQTVRSGVAAVGGITGVEFRPSADDRIRITREFLRPPGSVRIEGGDDGVSLSGSAPSEWVDEAAARLAAAELPWLVDTSELVGADRERPAPDVAELNGSSFFFTNGTRMTEDGAAALAEFADRLAALRERAAREDLSVVVTLTGFTDGVGDQAINEALADRRTQIVEAAILDAGHAPEALKTRRETAGGEGVADPALRRVTAQVELVEPPIAQ